MSARYHDADSRPISKPDPLLPPSSSDPLLSSFCPSVLLADTEPWMLSGNELILTQHRVTAKEKRGMATEILDAEPAVQYRGESIAEISSISTV